MYEKVKVLILERPKYKEILERAVKVEEDAEKGLLKDSDIIKSYGWEWHHVQAYPAELMRLVRDGIAKINYKSRKYTHYRLVNRDEVKRALSGV